MKNIPKTAVLGLLTTVSAFAAGANTSGNTIFGFSYTVVTVIVAALAIVVALVIVKTKKKD